MMDDDGQLSAVARAMSRQLPVDWEAVERTATCSADRDTIRQLRVIATISELHRAGAAPDAACTWGSLTLLEHVAHGSFGDVYRALDPRLDREVALKLLRRRDGAIDAAGTAAIEEARLLARVRHPNVVTIHGADRIDGRVGLWMEFVHGRTLEDLLQADGTLPAPDVAAVGAGVSRALAAVHAAGLLHRDIKAHNVMREANGRLVLMDFGAGREVVGDENGELTGTPLYLAPEILAGGPATVQSDLYSVGVLMFHLATGRYPVEGRTLQDIRASHADGHRMRLDAMRPDLPRALTALIDRALDPAPSRRFEHAAAMEEAATRVVTTRRTAVWATLSAAVAVMVLVTAVALTSWARDRGGPVGDRAVWTPPAGALISRVSADGRWITYADADGRLLIHDLATNADRALTSAVPAFAQYATHAALSPDGTSILYQWWNDDEGSLAYRIARVPRAGWLQPRQLFSLKNVRGIDWFDWSPDGHWMAAAIRRRDGTAEIALGAISDGTVRTLRSRNDWYAPARIYFSPDSKYLAYDLPAGEGVTQRDVFVRSIEDNGETAAVVHGANDVVVGWSPDGTSLLFSSDRTGSTGLWSIRFAEGKVLAPPDLLKPDIGAGIVSLGVTRAGVLYADKRFSSRDIVTAPIDLEAGLLTGPPVPFSKGFVDGARAANWSPDGRYLAYPVQTCHPDCVAIRSVATGEVRVLPATLNEIIGLSWSPDGRSLLTRGRDLARGGDGIFRIDVESGGVTPVFLGLGLSGGADWSPDGQKVYFIRNAAIIERTLSSGFERVIYAEPGVRNAKLSPDGRHLLAQRQDSSGRILRVVPITGNRAHDLVRLPTTIVPRGVAWTPDSGSLIVVKDDGVKPEFWQFPIDGGQARKFDIDPSLWISGSRDPAASGFSLSPDGRRIAFQMGKTASQVWALENFLPVN